MTSPGGSASHHEVELIRAFIAPHRQERFLMLLRNPKSRRKLVTQFANISDSIGDRALDLRFAHRIPPSEQSKENIYGLLRGKGAPETCHVIGESELDGQEVNRWEALDEIFGVSFGNFLSCIPGKLAYFGGENNNERYILER